MNSPATINPYDLTDSFIFDLLEIEMKKKTVRKKAAPIKTVKQTTPKKSTEQTLFFRRIVIISACLVLFVGIAAILNKGAASQAVAGISIMQGLFDQATVPIPQFRMRFLIIFTMDKDGVPGFSNAVRNIPSMSQVTQYPISKKMWIMTTVLQL